MNVLLPCYLSHMVLRKDTDIYDSPPSITPYYDIHLSYSNKHAILSKSSSTIAVTSNSHSTQIIKAPSKPRGWVGNRRISDIQLNYGTFLDQEFGPSQSEDRLSIHWIHRRVNISHKYLVLYTPSSPLDGDAISNSQLPSEISKD